MARNLAWLCRNMARGAMAAAVAGLAAAGVLLGQAQAHKGAHGVVKERMYVMKVMEKRLRLINMMVQGKAPFDAEKVHERGRVLLHHAERIPQLFPPGSGKPPSEAAPGIWQNFDDFRHRADQLKSAALLLMEASAATLPEIAREVQATCKGCHEKYRIEKDD